MRPVVVRQRAAVDRLRRDLFGSDGSLNHPYFRELRRLQQAAPRPLPVDALLDRFARSDIVYVGDFHANPACQSWTADLLTALSARVPRLGLCVEFVYTRQQTLLDLRQRRAIDDPAFLRRLHYREEWGYPWNGFRDLLDRARQLGIPVLALDQAPRGGVDGLSRRDAHAARILARAREGDPGRRLVVLFGESHVTPGHIPRRVGRLLASGGLAPRQIVVLHDPDAAYWELMARGEKVPDAAALAENVYAVFHTPPLAKYEAYRQVLDRWRGDVPPDEEVDLTPAVHHLIGMLRDWMGLRRRRVRLEHRGGWVEDLEDAYPEVYSGPDASTLLAPILEEHGRSQEEIEDALRAFAELGALYEPRSNSLFLERYRPERAAAEGARFLRTALSGRLFEAPDADPGDPAERAYGAAFNEALAYLGARLVDPRGDRPAPRARRGEASEEFVRARMEWLARHRRFEASGRSAPPPEVAEPLRSSRTMRRALARDLGHRLGRILFTLTRDGTLSSRALRGLFSRRLDPPEARRFVLRLLRGYPA